MEAIFQLKFPLHRHVKICVKLTKTQVGHPEKEVRSKLCCALEERQQDGFPEQRDASLWKLSLIQDQGGGRLAQT